MAVFYKRVFDRIVLDDADEQRIEPDVDSEGAVKVKSEAKHNVPRRGRRLNGKEISKIIPKTYSSGIMARMYNENQYYYPVRNVFRCLRCLFNILG